MTVHFASRGRRLLNEEVAGLERNLHVAFPKDCREFLLNHNASKPEPNIYRTPHTTTSVDHFLGISDKAYADFISFHETYESRLPERVIAIANAAGGNLICLNLADGAIYFWDHEGEAMDDESPSFDNMDYLAPSFSEFLQKLEPCHFGPESHPGNVKSVWKRPGFDNKFKKFLAGNEFTEI